MSLRYSKVGLLALFALFIYYCDNEENPEEEEYVPEQGDFYEGGIVYYLRGDSGYVCSTADLTVSDWSMGTCKVTTSYSDGKTNTEELVELSCDCLAAQACVNYQGGDFDDWYLPSYDELIILFERRRYIGEFNSNVAYLSSTVRRGAYATYVVCGVFFSGGERGCDFGMRGSVPIPVRPIRKFYITE